MTMTPEAKKALSSTIRALRAHLLDGLHSETEQAYRLSITDPTGVGLDEAARERRARLEGWIDEQVRALPEKQVRKDSDKAAARARFRRDAEKQAAYTLLGRVIMLRLLEAAGLRKPHVVTGAWESRGFKEFREHAPGLVRGDRSEGYAFLLQVVFEDLATELPGLYGPGGVGDLIPVPVDTWRHVVETLDDPALASCWADDMTLGWVYQYWNDPEREALDAKLNKGGKLESHEIASKTQMFTERYMVDWLLQNSLGPMWLAICAKNHWTAEVKADGTLDRLEVRRVEWRAKRDAGEVALTELMPLYTAAERRWAYYVPQDLPADAPEHAPASVRELKLLDPAVGSGHFLVVAFDLLFALYQEEARHRGEADLPEWSDRAIVERILEHNLHGLDLDRRAIQIAAAALWLKARQTCREARPRRLNLVASSLRLGGLPKDDPALVELRRAVERETGIPAHVTDTIVDALHGADYLGSLLRIDRAVDAALDACEDRLSRPEGGIQGSQGDLLSGTFAKEQRVLLGRAEAKTTILDRLEDFLGRHTGGEDLGLRLRGEQLATGVRFVRMLRERNYDMLVGNPPYQDTSDIVVSDAALGDYADAGTELFAMFMWRAMELVKPHSMVAMVTKADWLHLHRFRQLRRHLERHHVLSIANLGSGAFEQIKGEVVQPVTFSLRTEVSLDSEARTSYIDVGSLTGARAKVAGLLIARAEWRVLSTYRQIEGSPWILSWDERFVSRYSSCLKLKDVSDVRQGMATGNNTRFLLCPHEVHRSSARFVDFSSPDADFRTHAWVPYIKGADSQEWFEPGSYVVRWRFNGLQIKLLERNGKVSSRPQNEDYYFKAGIAFASTGSRFSARLHRFCSVFDVKGQSVFVSRRANVCCVMNSVRGREILQRLNPTISFQVGDAKRMPLFDVVDAEQILDRLNWAFSEHESRREPSVEFRAPGPSPWRRAQEWAQCAIDRPEGSPLSEFVPEYDPEPASDHLSYALGVVLGRFGAKGEGILDPAKDDLGRALPAGILFLDTTLTAHDPGDSLGHPATVPLRTAWQQYGHAIAPDVHLRGWLAVGFFGDHLKMYDNRPIHWPLSSEKRTFVAWVTIHRWTGNTLRILLAEHLVPRLTRLEGELADLRAARDGADKKAARAADKRFAQVQKWRDELAKFIADVEQCAEKGPPPEGPKCPPRQVDARYVPDLDDGVMINSAALWPLLTPQWKDPRKWWRELASAEDKKDYDWSHLAMRYWPDRVDAKCRQDPSLAVAHGCFWKYHPARAWAWELRLQDEIAPDFLITEAPYRGDGGDTARRAAFLATRGAEALALVQAEILRRFRKRKQPLADYFLRYPGLWSRHSEACWQLENAVIQKQKAPFRLLAEDEPEARATYIAEHPRVVGEREKLLERFAQEDMFALADLGDDEPDDDATAEDEASDDEEDA